MRKENLFVRLVQKWRLRIYIYSAEFRTTRRGGGRENFRRALARAFPSLFSFLSFVSPRFPSNLSVGRISAGVRALWMARVSPASLFPFRLSHLCSVPRSTCAPPVRPARVGPSSWRFPTPIAVIVVSPFSAEYRMACMENSSGGNLNNRKSARGDTATRRGGNVQKIINPHCELIFILSSFCQSLRYNVYFPRSAIIIRITRRKDRNVRAGSGGQSRDGVPFAVTQIVVISISEISRDRL